MPKVQENSKAALQLEYNVSAKTVYLWIKTLVDNAEAFAEDFNNPDYLCFKKYNRFCKILTPKQVAVFRLHYGKREKL